MPRKQYTEGQVVEVLKDYRDSGDTARVVGARHGVNGATVTQWAKKAGLEIRRRNKNWGLIRQMLG